MIRTARFFNRQRAVFFSSALVIYFLLPQAAVRAAAKNGHSAARHPSASSPVPKLRSAWMDRIAPRPRSMWSHTVAEEVARLQAHFQLVEQILIASSSKSLAVATHRYEVTSGRALTREERARLWVALYLRRVTQLLRLREYREAGRFPLNEVLFAPPRPIFVDARGTACAVGYLMLRSGQHDEVSSIAGANNFVVIPDVQGGPLVAWVLESGLTQEEAALIQPSYDPPQRFEGPLSQFLLPGSTTERDGLMYSNFSLSASQRGAPNYDPSEIQLITDLSDIIYESDGSVLQFFEPSGTNFLALHGELGTTTETDSLLWHLGFDVTVTDPTRAINAAYLTSDIYHMRTFGGIAQFGGDRIFLIAPNGSLLPSRRASSGGFDAQSTGYVQYQTEISSGGSSFGTVSLGDPAWDDFANHELLWGSREISLPRVQNLHVETQLLLAGDAFSFDITHEFTLVPLPEPSTFAFALLGFVSLSGLRWRRRS